MQKCGQRVSQPPVFSRVSEHATAEIVDFYGPSALFTLDNTHIRSYCYLDLMDSEVHLVNKLATTSFWGGSIMTKAELIEKIQGSVDGLNKKQTAELVSAMFETLTTAIKKDGRFSYPGFGTFSVKKRKARKGRNPRTGQEITIKASKTVNFKPAPSFKDKL
jgi:DNA-binding protein HU-beta